MPSAIPLASSIDTPSLPAARRLADRAVELLIAEAMLTPKPALVDQRGPGAHRDLDLMRLLRSARALRGAFLQMALVSLGREPDRNLREALALAGRLGERDMLVATAGSNAHRGAIWVIGLLLAGRVIAGPLVEPCEVAQLAARIASFPDRYAPSQTDSNGARACRRFGVMGARGEALAGFPHVIQVGLPALQAARAAGASETCARLDALMAIMARLDDTCLLHRGGREALDAAQAGARAVLAASGTACARGWSALLKLDAELLSRGASPGGCADLLAACLFLDRAHTASSYRPEMIRCK